MKYVMLYLPVGGELEDEGVAITPSGELMRMRPGLIHGAPKYLKRAAPFIVRYEYNIMHIVGPCPPEVAGWFKSGDEIPSRCVDEMGNGVCEVSCPTCGTVYKQEKNEPK